MMMIMRQNYFVGSKLSIPKPQQHRLSLPTSTTILLGMLLSGGNHHVVSAMMMNTKTSSHKYNAIVRNQKVPGLKHGMDYIQLGDSDLVVSKICCKCRCMLDV